MASSGVLRTLYEDWQVRRDQLLLASDGIDAYRQIRLRVFDFLLRRYRDAPEAQCTAAFPLTADVCVNDRAIIVHRHVAMPATPTVSSADDAHQHVKSVLERMYSTGLSESQFDSLSTEHLANQREMDRVRLRLCHADPLLRVLAAVELSERGTLHDIGLFCDLLALPPDDDEHPYERAALTHALARLSGVTSTNFDLTNVIPPHLNPNNAEVDLNNTEVMDEIDGWVCSKCEERVPENFDVCWSCGTTVDGKEDPAFLADSDTDEADSNNAPAT
jgi:hypothetical protein